MICLQIILYMHKEYLASDNLQWIVIKPNPTHSYVFNIYV